MIITNMMIIVSWAPVYLLFYQLCFLSECGVCFVNFCTIKLNKRLLTTGCAAEMRWKTTRDRYLINP